MAAETKDKLTTTESLKYVNDSLSKQIADIQTKRGTGLLNITTAPSSYTTATGGFTPVYRIALSTVLTQSKASEVLVGDTLAYSYYRYPVGYVDSSYVYLGARVSVRGATGASGEAGAAGADGKSAYAYAQDGGFEGSESDFAKILSPVREVTSAITPTEVYDALLSGRQVLLEHIDSTYGAMLFNNLAFSQAAGNLIISSTVFDLLGFTFCAQIIGDVSTDEWRFNALNLATTESVSALIDEKLGAIENGTY